MIEDGGIGIGGFVSVVRYKRGCGVGECGGGGEGL